MKRIDMSQAPLLYDLLRLSHPVPNYMTRLQYWEYHPQYTIHRMREDHYLELIGRFYFKRRRKNRCIAWSYYNRNVALMKVDRGRGKDLTTEYYYIENRIMPTWRPDE